LKAHGALVLTAAADTNSTYREDKGSADQNEICMSSNVLSTVRFIENITKCDDDDNQNKAATICRSQQILFHVGEINEDVNDAYINKNGFSKTIIIIIIPTPI
jgi:hypothetical protein